MWRNLISSYNNNEKYLKNTRPLLSDSQGGCCSPRIDQNMDCLMHVLSQLPINERVKCRLVCKTWREAIDKLFSGQRYLRIIYNKRKNFDNYYKINDSNDGIKSLNTYITTKQISFQLFHQMMTNFPSLESLVIKGVSLGDINLYVMANTCRQLTKLSLTSCIPKKDSYHNNNYINNNSVNSDSDQLITTYGWNLLINRYRHCLKHLTIKNCNINDTDCQIILLGFPYLTHLDLRDNEALIGTALHYLGITDIKIRLFFQLNVYLIII